MPNMRIQTTDECERQIILYATHEYKHNDVVEDLKIIISKSFGLDIGDVSSYTVFDQVAGTFGMLAAFAGVSVRSFQTELLRRMAKQALKSGNTINDDEIMFRLSDYSREAIQMMLDHIYGFAVNPVRQRGIDFYFNAGEPDSDILPLNGKGA